MAETESLKEKNQLRLGGYVFLHCLVLAWVLTHTPHSTEALKALSAVDWIKVGEVLAIVAVAVLLNSLATSHLKAVLVFWNWRHPLPGARFTELMLKDARFDASRLTAQLGGQLPKSPAEQNTVWFKMYRGHEKDPAVRTNHQEFLLLRDMTWLTFLFTLFVGGFLIVFTAASRPTLLYVVASASLFFLLTISARHAGERLVLTVLACESTKPEK